MSVSLRVCVCASPDTPVYRLACRVPKRRILVVHEGQIFSFVLKPLILNLMSTQLSKKGPDHLIRVIRWFFEPSNALVTFNRVFMAMIVTWA